MNAGRLVAVGAALLVAGCQGTIGAGGAADAGPGADAGPPWELSGWELTFHDEFDGESLDLSLWSRRFPWGEAVINEELQAYVDDALSVQDGRLRITGSEASGMYAGQTLDYRSGLISSLETQKYGRFEVRCRLPAGKGLWPAFWLLGENEATGVNEIDVFEVLGQTPGTVYMNLHWGSDYGAPDHQTHLATWEGPDMSQGFHTFAVEWTAGEVRWLVDGVQRHLHEGTGTPQVPMHVIVNLAIGGVWPGAPDGTTSFPAHMDVDYVRAWRKI